VETLLLAQKQNGGWLSPPALESVAQNLNVPLMRVLEVSNFYPLLNVVPVGTHCVRICTTASCWLKGSADLGRACQKWLGVGWEETTVDGMFSLKESGCLGDCTKAPVIRINETLYGELSPRDMTHLLQQLAEDEKK
jgi:NADH:ubiquinone oxidoreductase subunit E